MSVIKLLVKIRLTSQDMAEAEGTYDLGNIAKSGKWVWTEMGIPVEEIYKVIAYSKSDSLIILYDTEEKILVGEPFDNLFERWKQMIEENNSEDRPKKEKQNETSEAEDD